MFSKMFINILRNLSNVKYDKLFIASDILSNTK